MSRPARRPAGGKRKGGTPRRPPAAQGPPPPRPPAPALPDGPWTTSWPRSAVAATAAGLFLLGAFLGLGGAFLHERWVSVGVRLPVGLVLGLATSAAVGVAGGMFVRSRAGAVLPALGWTFAVLFLTQPRPEGDVVVGGGGIAYAFMLGGVVTQILVTVVPYGTLARADRP